MLRDIQAKELVTRVQITCIDRQPEPTTALRGPRCKCFSGGIDRTSFRGAAKQLPDGGRMNLSGSQALRQIQRTTFGARCEINPKERHQYTGAMQLFENLNVERRQAAHRPATAPLGLIGELTGG